ncbi:efflux RND transporter periplasmic adaptor subunit [Flavisolibacter nicotianae]|uniref:efflux RND transporter periplasmic adaptor subunit n=1 Tax=Flavisolibacter nicotianae TaxID=2364882 RepID=UPI000EB4D710|nr:efflux RND transporter periplasmic adaptor subunit [Flavisolibacter nicotianae]
MNKTLKWTLIAAGALAVVFAVVKSTRKGANDGMKVTAEVVRRRTLVETVSASGKLYPEMEIRVGSPISGQVVQLAIAEGDSVNKGQELARIQGEKGSAASPQRVSLPNIPPGFEGLLQNMQAPRTTASPSSAILTSPIGGTVIALNVKMGERIGAMQLPGSELLRIADMRKMEVRVDVNENNIIKIAIGDSADVEVEAYNKRKFKGVVTGIANGSSRKDATSFLSNDVANYEVHIRLLPSSYADLFDSGRRSMPFRPGMNARADIKTKTRQNVISVPVGAVVSKPKGSDEHTAAKQKANTEESTDETLNTDELEEVVYVIKSDGTVEKRVVTTGIQDINYFEITAGLKEGEKLVTGPYTAVSKNLRSGQKVTVVSKEQIFQND